MADTIILSQPPQPIQLPTVPLAKVTQAGVDAVVKEVREGYANAVGVKASTVAGGTARVFADLEKQTRWGQLEAAGYAGWRRGAGVEAGGEVVLKLGQKK